MEVAVWNKLICYNGQRLLHIIHCTDITAVSYHTRGSSPFSGTSLLEVIEVSVTGKKGVESQPDKKGVIWVFHIWNWNNWRLNYITTHSSHHTDVPLLLPSFETIFEAMNMFISWGHAPLLDKHSNFGFQRLGLCYIFLITLISRDFHKVIHINNT